MKTGIKEKVIIGIDPGTNFLGYGILTIRGTKVELTATGVIDLHKCKDVYLKLGRIHERVTSLIDAFCPDELAIEAPFFGKNVQSMLKLGRAQGVVIAAAIMRSIPITEYAPLKVKMAITGNGAASKEQVADIMRRLLSVSKEDLVPHLDATDALAVAYCHYLQMGRPQVSGGAKSWAEFAKKNAARVSTGRTTSALKRV